MEQENKLEQLKEDVFNKTLEIGKQLQDNLNRTSTIEELDDINKKLQQGIEQNVLTYRLRNLIRLINANDIDKTTGIKNHSEYKNWYYIKQLVDLTDNEELKLYVDKMKEEHLHK